MTDFLDLIQCPTCGAFYQPEITPTGQMIPHCARQVDTSRGQLVEAGAIEMDLSAIEGRIVSYLLTEGVVGPPLTGSLLNIEV